MTGSGFATNQCLNDRLRKKKPQGNLDTPVGKVAYKPSRVTGSKTRISNLSQAQKKDFNSHSDQPNGGSDLFIKFILVERAAEGGGLKK